MKLTVEVFQQIYSISTLPMDDFDRAVKMIEILTGKSEQQILKLPVKKFDRLAKQVATGFELIASKLQAEKPKNIIRVGRRWYKIHFDPANEPMNAGRYVEVATFGNEPIMNLHKIMASIVNALKWSWRKMQVH